VDFGQQVAAVSAAEKGWVAAAKEGWRCAVVGVEGEK